MSAADRRHAILTHYTNAIRVELDGLAAGEPARDRASAGLMRALASTDLHALALSRATYRQASYQYRCAWARLRMALTTAENVLSAAEDGDRRGAAHSARGRCSLLLDAATASTLADVAEVVAHELDALAESRAVVESITDQIVRLARAEAMSDDPRIRAVVRRLNTQTAAREVRALRALYDDGTRALDDAARTLAADDERMAHALAALRSHDAATTAGG